MGEIFTSGSGEYLGEVATRATLQLHLGSTSLPRCDLTSHRGERQRNEKAPCAFLFHGSNESLNKSDARGLADGSVAWPNSSSATPTFEAQRCGSENGNHGTQNPARVGTVVRSMCQQCPGYLATTRRRRRVVTSVSSSDGLPSSQTMRRIVVAPRTNPARPSTFAMRSAPMDGNRSFNWRTRFLTKALSS